MNGFFSDDEVSAAKQCLYGHAGKNDGIPRHIRRTPGDGRRKLECDDILNLYAFLT